MKRNYIFTNPHNYINPRVYRRGAFYRLADSTVRMIDFSERLATVECINVRVTNVPLQLITLATPEQVAEHLALIRGEVSETAETEHPIDNIDRTLFAILGVVAFLILVALVKFILLLSFTAIAIGIVALAVSMLLVVLIAAPRR